MLIVTPNPRRFPMDMKTSPLAALNDCSLLKTDALINGEWIAGADALRRATTRPPAAKLADVANLGAADAEAAIAAANAAWPAWRGKTAKERACDPDASGSQLLMTSTPTTWRAS